VGCHASVEGGAYRRSDLAYGYLVNDNVEPFLEVGYKSQTDKVGDILKTESVIEYGLGMIFNLPIPDEEKAAKNPHDKESLEVATPKLSISRWIPYIGLLIVSRQTENVGKSSTGSDMPNLSHRAMVTKLLFGTRYMIFTNVGLNFSMKVNYRDSESEATAPSTEKGTSQVLTIETNLLSLTLLF